MQCFMIAFLYLLFVLGSEGITSHSVTVCSASAVLSCSVNEMIHVERITYYNGTDCNQAVTDLQACGQPVTGSDTGLTPSCNGKVSCNEILYYTCPGSKAAKLDYRCIPGSNVKHMCQQFILKNTKIIFLSTPNYPRSSTFTDISPCRCSIRGSNVTSIQILELVLLTSDDGTNSSLEINYGDGTYKTESFSDTPLIRRVYNKRLSTTSTTVEITLNHNSINKQYLWIEVQGVAMRVACNSMTTSTSSTKSPPTTTQKSPVTSTSLFLTPFSSTSSSLSPPSSPFSSSTSLQSSTEPQSPTESAKSPASKTNEDKDTINITLAVLLSLCLLIICIATVIIIVLLRRKKLVWVKKSPQVERERSPYSGLDLNQRVAGNDGTYQELNTRNSTPQYNNVSQNTHNDYYNLN